METLKGLFDSKHRNRRNFLLENMREVKAKSMSNGQKNEVNRNLPLKARASSNSFQCSSRPSTLLDSSRSAHEIKNSIASEVNSKALQNSRKETTGKLQQCKPAFKPKETSSKSLKGAQTMNYIHQENVPFEWTEVCPSLISHNICHQGVQTENRKCENLLESSIAHDGTIVDCEQGNGRTKSAIEPSHFQSIPVKDYSRNSHKHSGDMTKRSTDNIKESANVGLSLKAENIQSTIFNKENDKIHVSKEHYGNSHGRSHLIHEKLQDATCQKLTSSRKKNDDAHFYASSYQKGAIPKYLVKRKAEQALASAQSKDVDMNCPAGHVVMPDNERRETLDMILKNYNDLIMELNRIPVRTDTLKMKQRKIEIEKQLDKLEEGLRVFSRSKIDFLLFLREDVKFGSLLITVYLTKPRTVTLTTAGALPADICVVNVKKLD